MLRTEFLWGHYEVGQLLEEAPIEIRAAFEIAIERADFIRAADVIEHEWGNKI